MPHLVTWRNEPVLRETWALFFILSKALYYQLRQSLCQLWVLCDVLSSFKCKHLWAVVSSTERDSQAGDHRPVGTQSRAPRKLRPVSGAPAHRWEAPQADRQRTAVPQSTTSPSTRTSHFSHNRTHSTEVSRAHHPGPDSPAPPRAPCIARALRPLRSPVPR